MRLEKATVVATKLRVFLLDSGKNQSLLSQLGIKNQLLFPTRYIEHIDIASNMVFSSQLVALEVTKEA